ncbi:MAG TPA: hypothetical protein VF730_13205 [Terracidiphilus sp.]
MSTPNVTSPPAGPSIPLSADVRSAYENLRKQIQTAIDSTMDEAALEALNPQWYEVDQVLTKDDEYKLTSDTAIFAALKTQIDSTNQGLKTLRLEIEAIASHFAMAGTVIAAIDKLLSLIPGA